MLLAPVFYLAAPTEVRGSLASKVHWTFDPYIFPQEKCRDRFVQASGLNYRADFFWRKIIATVLK